MSHRSDGNEVHKRILASMKNDASKFRSGLDNSLKKGRPQSGEDELEKFFDSQRTKFQEDLVRIRPLILKNKIANFIFDYNTAEAVLLSSAILINLAGICFDSSRFLPSKMSMPGIKQEYDSLAYAILVIMFATIIFWFVSMIFDIILVSAPQLTHQILDFIEKRAGNVADELRMRRERLLKNRNLREKKEEEMNQAPAKKNVVPTLETGDVVQIQNPMLAKKREQTALVATKDAMAIVRARTAVVKPPVISPRTKARAVVESDSEDSSGAEDYPKPRVDSPITTTTTISNTASSTAPTAAAPPDVPAPATAGPITTPRARRHVKEEEDDDDADDM